MKGYFQKTDLRIDLESVNKNFSELRRHGVYKSWQKYGVAYKKDHNFAPVTNESRYLDDEDASAVLAQIPDSILSLEKPEVWMLYAEPVVSEGRVLFPPHVDVVRLCSINIYFQTNGEKTAYYEYSPGGDIHEVASFIAQDGDVYLLNSNKPHSVEMLSGIPRASVSVSFLTTPYEAVEEALRSTALA